MTIDREEIRDGRIRNGSSPACPVRCRRRWRTSRTHTTTISDPVPPCSLADDVPETTATYLSERREDYPGVAVSEGWQQVYRFPRAGQPRRGLHGGDPGGNRLSWTTSKGYRLNERVGKAGVEKQ